ncbi:MAG: NAD(P)H-hydrate dehydratase [Lachnospiraceae bacterium]|nr:NAD(P)H-hydrate dehydratase [Lachnospiraceae bacterium]
MKEILSVENMRNSDAATIAGGIPGRELMYRAGKGIFDSVQWKAPVAIVAGSGNNAGDGYVIAKLLHDTGIECEIILLKEKFSDDGRYYYDICADAEIKTMLWNDSLDLSGYNTIADCIFGTGFRGEVSGTAKEVIAKINESKAYVVSVDINSGLNGDSGMAESCVISDLTVSIGSFQPGHFLNMAKDVMKEKLNIDIGIEPAGKAYQLIEKEDIYGLFQPRKNYSNKGTYGYTALIGGSERYSGAIRLAAMAEAAMRSGAGVVKTAAPKSLGSIIMSSILESTYFPLSENEGQVSFSESEIAELISNVKTAAFGMGIGTKDGAEEILKYLLKHYRGRLIVDADGLTLLSRIDKETVNKRECELVLTPHIKEFSRLTGKDINEILEAPVETAMSYARDKRLVLLLKGPSTIVTDGDRMLIVDAGCAGMATAGSGDVLSGILAAVCAYSEDMLMAVAAAAYINGSAGEKAQKDKGSISMTAGDTVANIPAVIKDMELSQE